MVTNTKKEVKLFKDFICYETEEEYLKDKSCINAHTIMSYAINDTLGFKDNRGEKSYFTVGKLTEDIVFHPDTVNDKYFIVKEYPSAQMKILADRVLSWILTDLNPKEALENSEDKIFEIIQEEQLFKTITKPETLLKKLKEEQFFEKLTLKLDNLNKLSVTEEDYNIASTLANNIVNSKVTKAIFALRNKEGIEFIDQFRIKIPSFFQNNLTAKIAVDLLVVDHNTRQVFFYDIKTDRNSTHDFIKESYNKYRIDLQLDFYHKALHTFIGKNFPTYALNPGKLIVVSKGYLNQEAIIFVKPTNTSNQPLRDYSNPLSPKELRDYILDICELRDFIGSLENLSKLDQVSSYYFFGNYVTLPN